MADIGTVIKQQNTTQSKSILAFHTLPWLIGWASLTVMGPFVMAKVVYRTILLALSIFTCKNKDFLGKTVLITGASSGLGTSLSHSFYKRGCRLILLARNMDALTKLKEDLLQKHNPPVLHVPVIEYLDLEDLNSIPVIVEKLSTLHGPIDILINNAGISYRGDIATTNISVDLKVMVTNYFGQIALTKEILKGMIKRKSGHIIGISSIQAKIALPNRSSYTASKHAFQSFFDCLRSEVAQHKIYVSVVCPSYMNTNSSVNAITGSGEKYAIKDSTTSSGMNPDYVAERIAYLHVTKEPEIILCPYLHKFLLYLRHHFPSVAFLIMKLRAKKDSNNPENDDEVVNPKKNE